MVSEMDHLLHDGTEVSIVLIFMGLGILVCWTKIVGVVKLSPFLRIWTRKTKYLFPKVPRSLLFTRNKPSVNEQRSAKIGACYRGDLDTVMHAPG